MSDKDDEEKARVVSNLCAGVECHQPLCHPQRSTKAFHDEKKKKIAALRHEIVT